MHRIHFIYLSISFLVYFLASLDLDSVEGPDPIYSYEIKATDQGSNNQNTDIENIFVQIKRVNEYPPVFDKIGSQESIAENISIGSTIYTQLIKTVGTTVE